MLAHARLVSALGLFLTLLVSGVLIGACNTTPTLPLPPPTASVSVPDEQGFALVEGEAQEDAYVSVLNETSREGVIVSADEDGRYSAQIKAESDDRLIIWQTIDGETGQQKRVVVPQPR
ncbi:MAG TPA: hypothetical protein VFZ61_04465 [Polyangiales bacterium]